MTPPVTTDSAKAVEALRAASAADNFADAVEAVDAGGRDAIHTIASKTLRAERANKPRRSLSAVFRSLVEQAKNTPQNPRDVEREKNLKFERAVACFKELAPPPNYEKARLTDKPPDWWAGTQRDRENYAEVVKICKAFAAGYGILALIGPRGTGKTRLGWATLIEACRLSQSAKYYKALRLMVNIKDTYGAADKTVASVLDVAIKPAKLMIDEVSEATGEHDLQKLTYILDERYDRKLGTILISNDERPVFIRKIGPSIKSRIDERGRICVITWPTFRDGHENKDLIK